MSVMEKISRRTFIKSMGAASAAVGLAACRHEAGIKGTSTAVEGTAEGEMPYRLNHNTGDKSSLIGYGCMRWPMIRSAEGKSVIDQDAVNELVDYAIEHGVNYFDSAPVYLQGQSEEATAKALLRHPRSSYYIATKCSNMNAAAGMEYEVGKNMYLKSLEYYQTDVIDYYLLHNFGDMATFKRRFLDCGLLDYFLEERRAGRIRNLGFSFHGNQDGWDSLRPVLEQYHWDFVQIQMNYIDWYHAGRGNTNASYLYETLDELNIPIVIMEPLLGGRLSNVPQGVSAQLKEREPERSIASWAFRFVGSYPRVLCVLSGMTYMEHLQDNLSTYLNFKPLTEEEKDWLTGEIATKINDYPLVACTDCKYCMPCPYGIDIPGIFTFYNNSVNSDSFIVSSTQKDFEKLRKSYLVNYNRAIPTVRQADHCINCNECVQHCPQHIRIPSELQRIDRYIESLKRETI